VDIVLPAGLETNSGGDEPPEARNYTQGLLRECENRRET
jgi:hypothetical protein